jgi:transposase
LNRFASQHIKKYIGLEARLANGGAPAEVRIDWGAGPTQTELHISNEIEEKVSVLKAMTEYYVFRDSSLSSQQRGHEQIVETIFKELFNAAKSQDGAADIIPPLYHSRVRDIQDQFDNHDEEGSKEQRARLAADIICSLTDSQAVEYSEENKWWRFYGVGGMGTSHGTKLAGITKAELKARLAEAPEDGEAVQRLVAAIEYKNGNSPADIEDKYGWAERTVYHWLDYLEERGLDEGLTDRPRSGRPPDLSDDDRQQFFEDLHESPEDHGYDRQAWFPPMARDHLETAYGVEYSLRHVRRLMREAGLSWRTARPRHYEADPEAEAEFREEFKKNSRRGLTTGIRWWQWISFRSRCGRCGSGRGTRGGPTRGLRCRARVGR